MSNVVNDFVRGGGGGGGDKFYLIFIIYLSLVPHLYTSLLQGPPSPSPEDKMVI